jgi:hypothetical protein
MIAPAPWRTDALAVLWLQRAPLGLGGLVLYRDTPVGPYHELFAASVLLRRGRPAAHVGFMAVDSEASRASGRANWALPKELATFAPAAGGATVGGDGWTVRVRTAVRGRAFPLPAAGRCFQPTAAGQELTFAVGFRGRARAAAVEVSATTPWLRAGRHAAVVIDGTLDVSAPDLH